MNGNGLYVLGDCVPQTPAYLKAVDYAEKH
jgi:hypothetical protein